MYDEQDTDVPAIRDDGINREEALVINLQDFRVGLPWPLLERFVDHVRDANQPSVDHEIRDKGVKGFRAAMRAVTPFLPLMEPMLRKMTFNRLEPWDRKHGGRDAYSYGMGWITKAVILMVSQVVWDADYITDDATKTIYITDIRVPELLTKSDQDTSILGIEPPTVESGYIPGEDQGNSERRLGDARDQGMRQDNILETPDMAPQPDVPEVTSVHLGLEWER